MKTSLHQWCRQHRTVAIPAGIFAGGLLLALLVFIITIYPQRNQLTGKRLAGGSYTYLSPPLSPESKLVQVLHWDNPVLGFRLPVGTYGRTFSTLHIVGNVYDNVTDTLLIEFEQVFEGIAEPDALDVSFEQQITAPTGEYRFELFLSGMEPWENLSVWTSETNDSVAVIGDEPQPGTLDLILCGNSAFLLPVFWCMALFIDALLAFLGYLCFVRKAGAGKIFVLAAAGFGFLHTLLYMPYSNYDDGIHIPSAYYYSSMGMGASATYENGTTYWMQRTDDTKVGLTPFVYGRDQMYRVYSKLLDKEAQPSETYKASVNLVGEFYQYLPQSTGVTIGRLLGLGQIGTLYLGRWFSLGVYIVFVCAAAYKNPFKNGFYLLGLCPFLLGTAGTFSYDTSILALAFLFVGQIFRFAYGTEPFRLRNFFSILVTGCLLSPLKFIYIPVLLLLLLIPFAKWKETVIACRLWQKLLLGLAAVAGVLMAGYMVHWSWSYLQTSLTIQSHETPWADAGGAYTLNMLLSNPAELLRLLAATALDGLDTVILSLGSFNSFPLPWWLVLICWGLLLSITCSPATERLLPVTPRQRITMGLCLFAVYGLALLAALQWTPIGNYYLKGMQGRYLLPVVPILMLILNGCFQHHKKEHPPERLFFAMCLVNAYTASYFFQSLALNRSI